MSVTLRGVSKNQYADTLNALCDISFGAVASVGAGVAQTTLQQLRTVPFNYKVRKVSVALTAIDSIAGSDLFNIVLGAGSYETAAVAASGTYTITGSPATSSNNTYTIAGTAVVAPQTTGNTVTQQALADVIVINNNATVNNIVTARSALGVVTITANAPGAAGNAVTTTASSSGGDTLTANQAVLASGANASGIVLAANDNSDTYGYPTNVAAAGVSLFGADIPFNAANTIAANAYAYPGNTGPTSNQIGQGVPNTGWGALATATGGYGIFVPTNYDAVYPAGVPLTLRAITQATIGSITNLQVTLGIVPVGLRAQPISEPGQEIVLPGTDY
jgi:hypothetical protein